MRYICANCGNSDEKTLFDEDDTIYCSKCCHRTVKSTGKDDLIICQYCGRLTDRKALYCGWCNCKPSGESCPKPTARIRKELNDSLKDFDKQLTPKNIRYWKIRKK